MKADLVPLVVGGLVFLASLISLKLGLSIAIVEILVGAVAGNAGLQPESWMTFVAGFGGILLTFHGEKIYSQGDGLYHPADEHGADVRDDIEPLRSEFRLYHPSPILGPHRGCHRQRGHPDVHRPAMVCASA